jgi:hypothetical protein
MESFVDVATITRISTERLYFIWVGTEEADLTFTGRENCEKLSGDFASSFV